MIISRYVVLFNLVAVACLWAVWEYNISENANVRNNAGPDVIVGDIDGVSRWGVSGNETAFSIGTVSCNIGNQQLAWVSNTNMHPVITQNLYRVKDGRIEMIGMSWLKHGFTALQQSLCGSCQSSGTGSALGVGCSDPYSAGINGNQSSLGPRSEVNATTGIFSYPKTNLPSNPGTLAGRLRVATSDITPSLNPGARYFLESMYVHPQDAAFGNSNNNASYRETFVSPSGSGWTLGINGGSPTVRMQPAINAWKAVHPDVRLFVVDVPDDGRIIVGMRTTPTAGGYHTEFAVENLNSHRSVRSFAVEYSSNAISNPGFHDVDYQQYLPDSNYSGTDWTPNIIGSEIAWSTATFTANQNANAIRWNTLYSFWCDSELPPRKLTLGMFRPGAVTEMSVDLMEPVLPESYELDGVIAGGQFENVFLSDNQYFRLSPSRNFRVPKIILELDTFLSTSSPSDFAFRIETAMNTTQPGVDVVQMIEMLNHDTDKYEVVDVRPATTTDNPVELTPSGDWSRFINSKTGLVKARIEWRNLAGGDSRTMYSWFIDIDQAIWLTAE